MRTGFNGGWLDDEHKQMFGINLGADHVAEHEGAIDDLYQILGIPNDESVMGIERYRVQTPKMDNIFIIEENRNNAGLFCVRYAFDVENMKQQTLQKVRNGYLSLYGDRELATAWDGREFGIRVKRPVNIKRIKRLHKAIEDKELAVWTGGGGVFRNAGLILCIIDAVSKENKEIMLNTHLDAKKLSDASAATGIKEKLSAANTEFAKKAGEVFGWKLYAPCGYLALTPAWVGDRKSNYSVMYWLNPIQQDKFNSGYFTVEELEQWIEGKGPVIKNKSDELWDRVMKNVDLEANQVEELDEAFWLNKEQE